MINKIDLSNQTKTFDFYQRLYIKYFLPIISSKKLCQKFIKVRKKLALRNKA